MFPIHIKRPCSSFESLLEFHNEQEPNLPMAMPSERIRPAALRYEPPLQMISQGVRRLGWP
jgi:hypothetical protein